MINTQDRKRGNPQKPSDMVHGLKCAVCGVPVPDKTWGELPQSKADYCQDHKNAPKHADPEDIILACINRGKSYWRPVPASQCREKGITNCTVDCPYADCIIDSYGLYL